MRLGALACRRDRIRWMLLGKVAGAIHSRTRLRFGGLLSGPHFLGSDRARSTKPTTREIASLRVRELFWRVVSGWPTTTYCRAATRKPASYSAVCSRAAMTWVCSPPRQGQNPSYCRRTGRVPRLSIMQPIACYIIRILDARSPAAE
jgi:hypothetical protein